MSGVALKHRVSGAAGADACTDASVTRPPTAATSQQPVTGSHPGTGGIGTSSTPPPSAASGNFSSLVVALGSTLAWMVASSLLIILNKHLYRMGFGFPFFVTGMGQVFSAAGGLALVYLGYLPLRPFPSARFAATNLAPVWISTMLTMFFGNLSYLYLSVAFIQILKAFTPALTLLLCVLFGLERFQWPLLTSVLLIAAGTAMAVVVESGTPAFQLQGFLAFMLSSVTEAARVVGAEVLLGAQRYNSAEACVYISGPAAVLLLLGAWVWERDGLLRVGPALFTAEPVAFLAAFCMSFLVNLFCFFAIQSTSSLTFKVAGCLKNVAVVVYGVVRHEERVTLGQSGGYLVSVVGFAMYSSLKMRVQQRRHKRHQGGAQGGPAREVGGAKTRALAAAGGSAAGGRGGRSSDEAAPPAPRGGVHGKNQ